MQIMCYCIYIYILHSLNFLFLDLYIHVVLLNFIAPNPPFQDDQALDVHTTRLLYHQYKVVVVPNKLSVAVDNVDNVVS